MGGTPDIVVLARDYARARKAQKLAGIRGHYRIYCRLTDEARRCELALLDAARRLEP